MPEQPPAQGKRGGGRQLDKSSLTPWLLRYATRHPRLLFVPAHTSPPFHIVSSGFGNAGTRLAHLDYTPDPRPRCTVRRCTAPLRQSANHCAHSESAYGLEQGQVGLLSAVRTPRQKACRSVPPRHLPFALILCRHSEFPPFLWPPHLRCARLRHHRTSPLLFTLS